MTDVAEKRRDSFRATMKEFGLKIPKWAKDSGVSANSIYNFLNGHSDSLSTNAYGKLARTARVPMWQLTGERPELPNTNSIWVKGRVEAGIFQEALEWDESQWYPVDVPVPERFASKARALEVRGDSMNLLYPSGSVVIWIEVLEFREPRDGDKVIVCRQKYSGEIEATVKEYGIQNDAAWLWPRSSAPSHQQPIQLSVQPDDTEIVEIKGIVIGSYRPEIY